MFMYNIKYINKNICFEGLKFVSNKIKTRIIMETAIKKPGSTPNVKLVAISAFFGSIGLLCIVFHISPNTIFEKLADFSAHHYFITGFAFLIISLICLKLYYNRNESPVRLAQRRSRAMKRRLFLSNLRKRMRLSDPSEESIYIKSEKISLLNFNNKEVLESEAELDNKNHVLQKAQVLGKLYNQKVIICFKDVESAKHTLATVWSIDVNNACLKENAIIPIKSIYKIEI